MFLMIFRIENGSVQGLMSKRSISPPAHECWFIISDVFNIYFTCRSAFMFRCFFWTLEWSLFIRFVLKQTSWKQLRKVYSEIDLFLMKRVAQISQLSRPLGKYPFHLVISHEPFFLPLSSCKLRSRRFASFRVAKKRRMNLEWIL